MKTNRFVISAITMFLMLLVACATVRADLAITVQDAQIRPGETGKVEVLIEGAATDLFAIFNYDFVISPVGTTVGFLQFRVPQASNEILRGDYVFPSDSGAFTSIPQNSPEFDRLFGGDAKGSGLDISLPSGTSLLLIMDVQHVLPFGVDPDLALGDEFTIVLQNSADTFFLDSTFTAGPTIDVSSFGASGTGRISMLAIPEPGAGMLGLGVVAAMTLFRRKKN